MDQTPINLLEIRDLKKTFSVSGGMTYWAQARAEKSGSERQASTAIRISIDWVPIRETRAPTIQPRLRTMKHAPRIAAA